jgi:hypothetical protein
MIVREPVHVRISVVRSLRARGPFRTFLLVDLGAPQPRRKRPFPQSGQTRKDEQRPFPNHFRGQLAGRAWAEPPEANSTHTKTFRHGPGCPRGQISVPFPALHAGGGTRTRMGMALRCLRNRSGIRGGRYMWPADAFTVVYQPWWEEKRPQSFPLGCGLVPWHDRAPRRRASEPGLPVRRRGRLCRPS